MEKTLKVFSLVNSKGILVSASNMLNTSEVARTVEKCEELKEKISSLETNQGLESFIQFLEKILGYEEVIYVAFQKSKKRSKYTKKSKNNLVTVPVEVAEEKEILVSCYPDGFYFYTPSPDLNKIYGHFETGKVQLVDSLKRLLPNSELQQGKQKMIVSNCELNSVLGNVFNFSFNVLNEQKRIAVGNVVFGFKHNSN